MRFWRENNDTLNKRETAILSAWNKISEYVKENYTGVFTNGVFFEWKHEVYYKIAFGVTKDGVSPHETIKIPTGLAMELPEGTFGAIFARSGLATKEGLRPSNCTGVCDSDYRGEYIVALHNDSNMSRLINPGERIAQLIVLPYVPIEFKEVDKLSDTDRGFGGFGSTGK